MPDQPNGPLLRPDVACTVVARNYLAAARVLATSYLEHHPSHSFVIAVIDGEDGAAQEAPGHHVVGPDWFDIDRDDYHRMATAYTVMELATAVKPFLLRRLRRDARTVTYLDPDIRVFAPFPEVADLAHEHSIVLTPHVLEPIPRDGKEPDEAAIMASGIFNLGFIAVGPGSDGFLDFWAERLRQDAIVAPEQQLFTDQRWVDNVPALFPHHVLRDPGLNVAYWNVYQRPISQDADGVVYAGDSVLKFFHFSGYRPEKPWLLTHHWARRPRTVLSEHPDLKRLCDDYGRALVSAGYGDSVESVPYRFNELPDGTPLTPMMRRVFRSGWVEAERESDDARRTEIPPHPFGEDGGRAFREWLTTPADEQQAVAGLHRWAMAVWASRADLRGTFTHPCGQDAAAFRAWCRTSGVSEKALATWALPEEPEPPRAPEDTFGVNVLGYLTAELGVGEMGRIVHDAITLAEVPVASVVEERTVPNRTALPRPATAGRPRFPVSLLCVNADQTPAMVATHPEVVHDRYRIGLWAWELEDFPSWQHGAFDLVDEIWTISAFCQEAFARHTDKPVKTIPVPVRDPGEPARRVREPGEPVQFLFAFDFNSIGQRKNPWGLVEAFRLAFPGRDDVRLVIKAINGDKNPESRERLRTAVADDPRIELLERYLSVSELDELYARSDCYVSLHRSEGFGLTVAEAMVRGLPVIATEYSSTTEFLDATTGWPVPCRLVPVGKGCHPYPETAVWAEPDLALAAQAMRAVADDPAEAARRGRAAREHILRTRGMDRAARWVRKELERAHETWRERRRPASVPEPEPDPVAPLHEAREALRWRADAQAPSRLPLAPALRRAVLRAIDHYDVHQRKVLGRLTDGVETTLRRLSERLSAVDARSAAAAAEERAARESLQRRIDDLDRAVRRLNQQVPDARRAALRLEADTAELRREVSGRFEALRAEQEVAREEVLDRITELRDRVDAEAKRTFDMFVERDRRADQDELELARLERDLVALHRDAALRHAPLPEGAAVVVTDAGALLLPSDDDVVLPWMEYHRSWETDEAELMARLAEDGDTFIDVGAHVGYHTLRLLRDRDLARVVAVEANPATADLLRRNLDVNLPARLRERVTLVPAAAWDNEGTVRLAHPEENNSGDFRVSAGGDGGVEVPAVRLDDVPELAEGRVGLVKVDLQGRDHRALAGLAEVLRRDLPNVVCEFCPDAIEELGDDPEQVLAGYRALGYVVRGVDGEELPHDKDTVRDARASETGFLTLWLSPAAT